MSAPLPVRHSGEGRNPAASRAHTVEPRGQLGSGLRRNDDPTSKVATDFEALFIGQLLKAARAAKLADDPLAGNDSFRDLADRQLAQSLARSAPLGVAKLLK